MTLRSLAVDLTPARAVGTVAALVELAKPRMVTLILVTTAAGFFMGSAAAPDWSNLALALAGTGLAAAGTLALNQVMERDIDAVMERTKRRPLPEGRLKPLEALLFGAGAILAGLGLLAFLVNPLASAVTAAVVISYLLAYTPLKRRTALCTLVGAFPGALPPVIGWTAASGDLAAGALALFGILFFWQMPHSLAIAWLYREDYGRAGVRVLPTVHPDGRSTGRQIVGNSVALLIVGLAPALMGLAGGIYLAVALLMGGWMLADGIRAASDWSGDDRARRLLYTSFIYLPVVLVVMVLDRQLLG